jgi:hypothetical protein
MVTEAMVENIDEDFTRHPVSATFEDTAVTMTSDGRVKAAEVVDFPVSTQSSPPLGNGAGFWGSGGACTDPLILSWL